MVTHAVERSSALQLGPVQLRLSRSVGEKQFWVMSRKGSGDFSRPRFGVLYGAFRHQGPDGRKRLLVRVKWQENALLMYHRQIRAPVVRVSIDTELPTITLARDVVPYHCFGLPDPYDRGQLVMLAEGWHVLRHLGFDVIP